MTKEDFAEILDEIGERLSGPAQHLFELAVQRKVSGGVLMATIGLLACLLLSALAWRLIKRASQLADMYDKGAIGKREGTYYHEDPSEAVFINGVASAAGAFVGLLVVLRGLFIVINAEWYALSLIVETIR